MSQRDQESTAADALSRCAGVMTEEEAYRVYTKYADESWPEHAWPFYTFAGWLKHKGIRIVENKNHDVA